MQRLKAAVMIVAARFVVAAITISFKVAADDGMHMNVLITYRYLVASILIFPIALYFERNKRPKLTWTILFQAFLCATFGGPMPQNIYAKSIVLTSPTFTAAFTNLIPPLTFIVAVLFRLEKVEIRKSVGKAKVIGTIVGVGGAMILTFFKGHQLNVKSTHLNLLHGPQRMDGHVAATHKTSTHDHIFSSILAFIYSLSIALFYVIQSKLSANYPCHYSNTFLYSTIGFIQSLVYAVITERSWSEWKLNSNTRVFLSIFQGICSLLVLFLVMAAVHLQGPMFVSIFYPLVLVFVAAVDFLVFDEKLYVGTFLGSIIIIAGLYLVLWGKSKETKRLLKPMPSDTSNVIASTSFSVNVDKEDDFPTNSLSEKHKGQEIVRQI